MTCSSTPKTLFFILCLLLCFTFITANYVVDQIRKTSGFVSNLLSIVPTNVSSTEARAIAIDSNGNIYIAGEIDPILQDEYDINFPSNVSVDSLGMRDVFLMKLNASGNTAWKVRIGSDGIDTVTAMVVDRNNSLYIAAYVNGKLDDRGRGPVVFKYSTSGQRLWAETYGSQIGGELFNAMVLVNDDIIVAGKIGPQSLLLSEQFRPNITCPLVLRLNSQNGAILQTGVAQPLPKTVYGEGTTIAVKNVGGSTRVFVSGVVSRLYNGQYITNMAVYSFLLPELGQEDGRLIEAPRQEVPAKISGSINEHSVYCVGRMFKSNYEEYDAFIRRFNTSDLASGWDASIGSVRFTSFQDIRSGRATEIGRDSLVDPNGNIHVLLDSSGNMPDAGGENELHNQRPAVVVLAPNGSTVITMQSNQSEQTSVEHMVMMDGAIIFVGSVVIKDTGVLQAIMSGVQVSDGVLTTHGDEFSPAKLVVGGDEQETEQNEVSKTRWVMIAGIAGGVVASVVLVFVVLIMLFKRRRVRNEQF